MTFLLIFSLKTRTEFHQVEAEMLRFPITLYPLPLDGAKGKGGFSAQTKAGRNVRLSFFLEHP